MWYRGGVSVGVVLLLHVACCGMGCGMSQEQDSLTRSDMRTNERVESKRVALFRSGARMLLLIALAARATLPRRRARGSDDDD